MNRLYAVTTPNQQVRETEGVSKRRAHGHIPEFLLRSASFVLPVAKIAAPAAPKPVLAHTIDAEEAVCRREVGMPMISQAEVEGIKHAMAELVGRTLSSVEFVHDYQQLGFDGPCLTALTLPSIRTASGVLKPESAGYRDALCSLIGVEVTAVEVSGGEVGIAFRSGVTVVVSLLDNDYTGPEAINYIGEDGSWLVV